MFWIHGETRVRVEEGFRRIADAAQLAGGNDPKADVCRLVHDWLSNEQNGQWFMIIDSADDCDVFSKQTEIPPNNDGWPTISRKAHTDPSLLPRATETWL